ncbi:MAG: hypothetical protein ACLSAH_02460 [Bilophila wadsworthia]
MTSSVLFTPVGINRMTLKNRIVMPAMASYHAAVNGEATEKLIRYHEERAKGGVGMNIVEATYVARSGNSFDLGLGISDDFMIKGLSKLTDAVHRHDGKIAIQLQHGGRFGNPPTSGCPRLLVSMIPGLAPTENARVMDADDIEGMVEAYVQAARRAVDEDFPILYRHTSMEDVPERHRLRYQRRAVPGPHGRGRQRLRHHGGNAMLLRADDPTHLHAQGVERRHRAPPSRKRSGTGRGTCSRAGFPTPTPPSGSCATAWPTSPSWAGRSSRIHIWWKNTPPGARTRSTLAWPVGRAA